MPTRFRESTAHHGVGRIGVYLVRAGDLVRDLARVVATHVNEVGRLVDRRMQRDVTDQGGGEVLVFLFGQTDEGIRSSSAICQDAPTRPLRTAGPADDSTNARRVPTLREFRRRLAHDSGAPSRIRPRS